MKASGEIDASVLVEFAAHVCTVGRALVVQKAGRRLRYGPEALAEIVRYVNDTAPALRRCEAADPEAADPELLRLLRNLIRCLESLGELASELLLRGATGAPC